MVLEIDFQTYFLLMQLDENISGFCDFLQVSLTRDDKKQYVDM